MSCPLFSWCSLQAACIVPCFYSCDLVFAPNSSEVIFGCFFVCLFVSVFFYLFVLYLVIQTACMLQLHMYAVFHPLYISLHFIAGVDIYPGQALQQRAPGPSLSQYQIHSFYPVYYHLSLLYYIHYFYYLPLILESKLYLNR